MMDIGRERFNDAVSGILNRPEYRYLKYMGDNIFNKAKNMLRKWIEELLRRILGSAGNIHVSEGAAVILMIVCIAVILSVLVLIAVKILKSADKNKKVRELFGTVINDSVTPEDMVRKSGEYESAGDLRNAVKFYFIGLLLLMHNHNAIYLDESKTNRELLYDLKKNSFGLTDAFGNIVGTFDACWYGHKDLNDGQYKVWISEAEAIWEGVAHEAKSK